MRLPSFTLPFLLLACVSVASAAVTLPPVLSDHAVFKASAATRIWGKAAPNEKINVALAGQTAQTQAGADGKWQVTLDLQKTGPGPFELIVKGTNEIKVSDVLVGEVWLASGQSNMDFQLKNSLNVAEEIAKSANPQIRFFKIGAISSPEAKGEVAGTWVVVDPQTAGNLSAVGYYFAKDLQTAIQQPIGVIQTSWGGSSVEAWISPLGLKTVPDLLTASERIWQQNAESNAQKDVFKRDFPIWLKAHGRIDQPPADPTKYAAPDLATTDWVPVKISQPISGPGLPATGAIWLRTEFDVPANTAGKRAVLRADTLNAIEKIYLNGQFLREKRPDEYVGPARVYIDIPTDRLLPGRNVLALRLYAPISAPSFTGLPPAIDKIKLAENWIAKAEYALPDPAGLPKPPTFPTIPPMGNQIPGFLYNGMVAPFLPYTLSGFIWYQGETNTSRAWQYRTAFSLMITDWRARFGQGELPFYYCQLANFLFKRPDIVESDWAELREAQSHALALPNTGQAVIIDVGEADDIHYLDKAPVGQRLAALALARTYGKKEIVACGPIYSTHKIEAGNIRVSFTDTAAGLVAQPLPATFLVNRLRSETAPLVRNSPNSELEGFQICGADHQWVWADAKIDGTDVIVSSPKVPAPIAVRYGWAANPTVNLTNSAGLPANPFRTDDFPLSTLDKKL